MYQKKGRKRTDRKAPEKDMVILAEISVGYRAGKKSMRNTVVFLNVSQYKYFRPHFQNLVRKI